MAEYDTALKPEDQGQAQPAESESSIFDPYLQTVPEEYRETVSGYLKDAERNVNTQLQEAATLRKQFGPYSEVDLSSVSPQQLSQVLTWVQQVGASPQAYQEWLRQEAEQAGLIEAAQQAQTPEDGQELEAYIQSRIQEAIAPLSEHLTQNEQAARQQAMENHISSTIAKLEADNKTKFTDDQVEAILALGEQTEGQDWIEQGYAKYAALTGAAQASLVNQKGSQPAPALRPGGQAAPAKAKNFADVREAALELMNQAL